LAKFAVESGRSFELDEKALETEEVKVFLRRAAAESLVLLKNERRLLPIRPDTKKIAVFGQNASLAVPTGGGSASLSTSYVISPLEAIRTAAEEMGATVDYSLGAEVWGYLPMANPYLIPAEAGGPIATLEYWLPSNNPGPNWISDVPDVVSQTEPDVRTVQESANVFPFDGASKLMAVTGQCNRVSILLVTVASSLTSSSSRPCSYPMNPVIGVSAWVPSDI